MTEAPLIQLTIDPDDKTPMFAQVVAAFRERIVSGQIPAGSRLPASRNLAGDLGVSRATVIAAYDQLMAEGFIEGRQGSGVYVNALGDVELAGQSAAPSWPIAKPETDTTPAPFQPGRADMRLFPHRKWGQCFAKVGRTQPEAFAVQSEPFGDPALRREIATYLTEWRGFSPHPDQILVTAGAADAIEICLRTLVQPGQYVALEDPGYAPLRNTVKALGFTPRWLEHDGEGAKRPPPAGNYMVRSVVSLLTPSSQFPLGGTMTPGRRLEHLAWAKTQDSWIIEDDYDSEFRYGGRPIPALSSFDQSGRTLYVGSFSKVFSDSLRLGYLVAPERLIPRIDDTLKAFGSKASLAPQRPLALFMESGEMYRHIRRTRRIYGERRTALLDLLHVELGDVLNWTDHQAGMQIAVTWDAPCDDVTVSRALAREGLSCPPLSGYFGQASAQNGLLLGFCAMTPEEMAAHMPTLKRILTQAFDEADDA